MDAFMKNRAPSTATSPFGMGGFHGNMGGGMPSGGMRPSGMTGGMR